MLKIQLQNIRKFEELNSNLDSKNWLKLFEIVKAKIKHSFQKEELGNISLYTLS
jgi:hypothetical protein